MQLLDESDSSDTDAEGRTQGAPRRAARGSDADSAYLLDGQTLHEQAARGNDLHAKVLAVRISHGGYSKDLRTSS